MKLLTRQDIAARWSVCQRTLDNILAKHRRGRLKPTKITKRTVRWSEERIAEFEQWRSV